MLSSTLCPSLLTPCLVFRPSPSVVAALERMIFPWATTSLLFRHRLYSLLRFFSWLAGLVGSTLILVWSSGRGCFEVPNDTWTLDATLQLESTQCGLGPGMWCLSFSVLVNFATVLAMELLEGRYQKELVDEVLTELRGNVAKTEKTLDMELESYISGVRTDFAEAAAQNFGALPPPSGTLMSQDRGKMEEEGYGQGATVDLESGTYLNLDAEIVMNEDHATGLTVLKGDNRKTPEETGEDGMTMTKTKTKTKGERRRWWRRWGKAGEMKKARGLAYHDNNKTVIGGAGGGSMVAEGEESSTVNGWDVEMIGEINQHIPATSCDSRLTAKVVDFGHGLPSRMSSLTVDGRGSVSAAGSKSWSFGGWNKIQKMFVAHRTGEDARIDEVSEGSSETKSVDVRSAIERILAQERKIKADKKRKKALSQSNVLDLLLITSKDSAAFEDRPPSVARSESGAADDVRVKMERLRSKINMIKAEEKRLIREKRRAAAAQQAQQLTIVEEGTADAEREGHEVSHEEMKVHGRRMKRVGDEMLELVLFKEQAKTAERLRDVLDEMATFHGEGV